MVKISNDECMKFYELDMKFADFAKESIEYIRDKKYTKYLFGVNWIFTDNFVLEPNKDALDIKIFDEDGVDYCYISFPWEHVSNNTWKEYIDKIVIDDIEREKKFKEDMLKFIEMRERRQLDNLLKKYGNPKN